MAQAQVQVKRLPLAGYEAAAYAVKMADVDVIAAYPITPQTNIVEELATMVANGELDAEYVHVESEHSAISAVVGASLTGARVFTATSSQGLALMHEILFITATARAPVVMAVVNRALSGPINIWNDHSDAMAERDTGWIQLWALNAQEVFDTILQAYKIAEDNSVLLPVMVNLDGYILGHTVEAVELPDEKLVKDFVPSRPLQNRLSLKTCYTVGVMGNPDYYYEMKYQAIDALERSADVIKKVGEEFGEVFGRRYKPLDLYYVEDAEAVLISMGSTAGTALAAVKRMRKRGEKVGLVRIWLYRPFPVNELKDVLKGVKAVGIVDRATCPGAIGGPVFADITTLFSNDREKPLLRDFIAGLGGRDIRIEDFEYMLNKTLEAAKTGMVDKVCEYVGLRW